MNQKLDCAAFVGVDWGDQGHAFCILPIDGGPAAHGTLKQEPEAIAAWVAQLRKRFGGRPVALCLEQSRGGADVCPDAVRVSPALPPQPDAVGGLPPGLASQRRQGRPHRRRTGRAVPPRPQRPGARLAARR